MQKPQMMAAAFKAWLRQISQHVAEASREGGLFGAKSGPVSDKEKATPGIGAVGAIMENTGVRSGDYGVLKAPKGLGPPRKQ